MPHLLLVDDNADHLFLTRRALRGVGMECTGVQTAEAAIDAIRSAPYDMILLDHNLPGMKGSELIARIRAIGIDTPVIMVTGGGSEQLAVDALKAGALDYIVKNEGYLTALPPRIQRALAQHGLENENRQLESERQAAVDQVTSHARRLRALQQASLKINSSLRPRDVRSQAVNQAAALLESEMASFFLVSEDKLTLQIRASRGLSVSYADTMCVPVGEGAIGRAVLKGEPVAITDVLTDERVKAYSTAAVREGFRSLLAVPLLMRGDSQGGLCVYDPSVRQWDPDEITLLQTLAQNVAIAYENAQLYDRLTSRVTELQSLNRIVTSLTASQDLGAALDAVVDHLRQLFGALAGAIILKESLLPGYHVLGTQGLSPEFRDAVQQLHRLGTNGGNLPVAPDLRAIAERRPQFIPDVQSEAGLADFSSTAQKLGFRSMLSVPLIPHDEPIGALSLFFTRRRRLDRQQRQLMDTVSSTVAVAVQRALLQDNLVRQEAERLALIESSRLKTEFISTVSHELRTPLASIEGYVQLILRGHAGDVPPLQLEFLQTVGRNSRRLCNLVDDLLDVSRIEAGSLLLERDPVEIGAVVTECADMIASQAEDRKMGLELEIAPDLPRVMGDFQRIGEIVTNFLSNAVKYGRPGTPIHVRAELSKNAENNEATEVIVSVKDEGIGISPDEVPKLFRKFYRVDNSTTRMQGGTGLGLAIAKYLVELHGGRVWVESEPDRGSTFFFALPAIHGA